MAFDRYLIAPLQNGLQLDMPPWLIMDDAYEQLNNAWIFRSRLKKRFGSLLMGETADDPSLQPLNSRLRILIDTTDADGDAAGNVGDNGGGGVYAIGQQFSIGDGIYTVNVDGNPGVLLTGGPGSGTFDTTTGDYTFTATTPLTDIYFYTNQPVMGFTQYQQKLTSSDLINLKQSVAFDTQFAYIYTTAWNKFGPEAGMLWHGAYDTNFFWSTLWIGNPASFFLYTSNFYVVNYNGDGNQTLDDPIRYYDGTNWVSLQPTDSDLQNGLYFLPGNMARYTGPYIKTARIIVVFQNRLLLMNTVENNNPQGDGSDASTNTNYPNRIRFSILGNPLAQNAWYEREQQDSSNTAGGLSLYGGGGFTDAPTTEAIVTAEFIRNRLIVYFDNSVYELVYTNSEISPFLWQKINTELGAESTFSVVPFDKAVIAIGSNGIHACNGSSVERIDSKIPNEVYNIIDKNKTTSRVIGIRDYFSEVVYWTLKSIGTTVQSDFPNKVLLYNYVNSTWAMLDDCITFWGYHEQLHHPTDLNKYTQVIIGNQQGFVTWLDPDVNSNATTMQITDFISATATVTIIAHNLEINDYIQLSFLNGVTITGTDIVRIVSAPTPDTVTVGPSTFVGAYTGGGYAARVSMIDILTKQFSPYAKDDQGVYLSQIKCAVETTTLGEISVDYYPDSTPLSLIQAGEITGANIGTNVLETFPYTALEVLATRVWHQVFFNSRGNSIQLRFFWNDLQMRTSTTSQEKFTMEGFIIYTLSTGVL